MSALATTQYYENVVGTLGKAETESFVRLYMAPGMQHCFGGPGPNFFAQIDLGSVSPAAQKFMPSIAPEANISSALEQWVTKGVAPSSIRATKYIDDLDPAKGVKMTRPLCPYPQIASYKGVGDTNNAKNF